MKHFCRRRRVSPRPMPSSSPPTIGRATSANSRTPSNARSPSPKPARCTSSYRRLMRPDRPHAGDSWSYRFIPDARRLETPRTREHHRGVETKIRKSLRPRRRSRVAQHEADPAGFADKGIGNSKAVKISFSIAMGSMTESFFEDYASYSSLRKLGLTPTSPPRPTQ